MTTQLKNKRQSRQLSTRLEPKARFSVVGASGTLPASRRALDERFFSVGWPGQGASKFGRCWRLLEGAVAGRLIHGGFYCETAQDVSVAGLLCRVLLCRWLALCDSEFGDEQAAGVLLANDNDHCEGRQVAVGCWRSKKPSAQDRFCVFCNYVSICGCRACREAQVSLFGV